METTTNVKNTAFTKFHIDFGARMVPFAGYLMPIEYPGGIKEEHYTVRQKLGVFDVSHMGEFWVKGPKALDFVQFVTSNDVAALVDGKVQYSCFPNGKGGIVDDLLVYRVDAQTYLLVVNAANIEKDWNWCVQHAKNKGLEIGKDIYDASDEICQLAIQGPLALKAMQKCTDTKVTDMEYYTFKKLKFAGVDNIIFATTGYTGSGGCEIYAANKDADVIWKAVIEAGKEYGIKPIGLGARDTLRLEMGYCLYGNDIDDSTSPISAGLGWITKFTDNKDFIDKELLLAQKKNGTPRKLRGFEMIDKGIPRHGYKMVDAHGTEIGIVTSGTQSPMLNIGIGMAYINKEFIKTGTEVYVEIRDKRLKAKVVDFPFYKG